MQRPCSLTVELPRKGSTMTRAYDASVRSFVLAKRMRSGRLVVHEMLDAIALIDIVLTSKLCLRPGAVWRHFVPPREFFPYTCRCEYG